MSYTRKVATWLVTDAGKKFSYYVAGTATSALLLTHLLPHTILLDQYKDFMHLYKQGFTVPVTPKLKATFEKALELTEVEQRDKHLFKPFTCYGFDIFSAGTSYSKYGVYVGLPANFSYEDVHSIDKQSIKLKDGPILWELDEGQLLLKSLVLSEKAKLYAIAREIKYRQSVKQMVDTGFAVSSFMGLYGLANTFNNKLNLYVKPLPARLILYCILSAFTFGSYALCKDVTQVYYERSIDEELKAKDPVFVEGGQEFYAKLLDRNKALRKLMGKEGERKYTVLGNENFFIRYRHVPLVDRKTFFDQPL